jgi:hypothetical protein
MNRLTAYMARWQGEYKEIGETRGNTRQEIADVERHLSAVGLTLETFANNPNNPLPIRTNPNENRNHDQYFTKTHLDIVCGEPYLFAGEFHQTPITTEQIGNPTFSDPTVHGTETVHRFSYRLDK